MRIASISLAIVCTVMAAESEAAAPERPVGELIEGVACQIDSSQTYTLYLPTRYDRARLWPVLLVFDPRGRSVLRPCAEPLDQP